MHELRYVLRMLRKSPVFTAVAIVSRAVLQLVLRQGMLLAFAGVSVGLAIARIEPMRVLREE